MRRRSSPISVKTTKHNRQSRKCPMMISRDSSSECQVSGKILANGSSKTAMASEKSILCLRTLAAAFRGSHSKTRLKLIPQSNRHVVNRVRTAYQSWSTPRKRYAMRTLLGYALILQNPPRPTIQDGPPNPADTSRLPRSGESSNGASPPRGRRTRV